MQALYLRWRPTTFSDVVGQEHITYTIRNALINERIGHAYLFAGPRGTGKTSMARLLAKAVNCQDDDPANRPCNQCSRCSQVNQGRFLDLIEIDAASHTSVDDVRELRERIAFSPNEGRYKVYIIDEVHRFSGAAFDALLKTIEEPPAHAIFILATTEIHKVPQTILSRCQRFDFKRIPLPQLVARLEEIVINEGFQAEPAALELVARQGTGSLRDSISLLDQLISEPGQVITLSLAQAVLGSVAEDAVRHLTQLIIDGSAGLGLDLINRTMDEGADARQFALQMVEYLRLVMLIQTGGTELVNAMAPPDVVQMAAHQSAQFPRSVLLKSLTSFNDAAAESRGGWQPQLPLELALLESIEALHETPEQPTSVGTMPDGQQAAATQKPRTQDKAKDRMQAAPTLPAEATSDIELGDVHRYWQQVLQSLRNNNQLNIQALLNSGRAVRVQGDTIIFQVSSDILRQKIEAEANRKAIEGVFQEVYGRPLKIRCRVGEAGSDLGEQASDLIAQDDIVAFAVNDLGGEIVHIEEEE